MHKLLVGTLVLPTWLGATAIAAKPMPPDDLVRARTAFAAAVAANDEKGAAALTEFPLKNTVFHAPPRLTRAAFAKLFADYREMTACIKTAPLEFAHGSWAIDCNGNVLHFGLRHGHWLHTEYENINE